MRHTANKANLRRPPGQTSSFMETLEAELREQIRAELMDEFQMKSQHATDASRPHDRQQNLTQPTVARERLEQWLQTQLDLRFNVSLYADKYATHGATHFRQYEQQSQSKPPHQDFSGTPSAPTRHQPTATAGSTRLEPDQASTHRPIRKSPNTKSVRTVHRLNAEDFAAIEVLKRFGHALPSNFTEDELKGAYRQSALLIHPDRHTNRSQSEEQKFSRLFNDLSTAVKHLARHFNGDSNS